MRNATDDVSSLVRNGKPSRGTVFIPKGHGDLAAIGLAQVATPP